MSKISAYPLPYMDTILQKLQKARYISTLDLSSAYHQIPLAEGTAPLTAFTVPGMGLFEFARMSYGVAGGPAALQDLVDRIIRSEMERVAFAYLDDIIIATGTFEDHLKWLEHILKSTREAGLDRSGEK